MRKSRMIFPVLYLMCAVCFLGGCKTKEEKSLSTYCDAQTQRFLQQGSDVTALQYRCFYEASSEYTVTDAAVISECLEALSHIKVTGETRIMASDASDHLRSEAGMVYNGEQFSFSFNGHHFESGGKLYELSEDAPLWRIAAKIRNS